MFDGARYYNVTAGNTTISYFGCVEVYDMKHFRENTMILLSILFDIINGQQVAGSCRWPWVKSIGTPEEAIEKVGPNISCSFYVTFNRFLVNL